jgi:hypothetical protein
VNTNAGGKICWRGVGLISLDGVGLIGCRVSSYDEKYCVSPSSGSSSSDSSGSSLVCGFSLMCSGNLFMSCLISSWSECSGLKILSTYSSRLLFLPDLGVSVICVVELVLGCDSCLCDSVSVSNSLLTGLICLLRLPRSVRDRSVAAGSVQLPGGLGGSLGKGVVGLVDCELCSSSVLVVCI